MIDRTNETIQSMREKVRREQERRYAFQRMLRATDLVLWRLEEMNRDGDRRIPEDFRAEIREVIATLPPQCAELFDDSEQVQATLDSIFAVQECLFRWRFPEWAHDDEDDLVRAS
jgi:hypothetical protein